MDIALWIVAAIAVLLGIAGMVLPLMPGTPLLFGGLWLAAWIEGYSRVSGTVVVLLAVMAVLAWGIDYLAATLGVKRVGASGKAAAGAAIGTVLGIFGGLPGLILGPIVGAMAGEWLARRDAAQAGRAGLGFIVAVAAKLGIAIAMLGVFGFAWFV
jgi:uncharacterized protein YqgC (DUF456 family)